MKLYALDKWQDYVRREIELSNKKLLKEQPFYNSSIKKTYIKPSVNKKLLRELAFDYEATITIKSKT